MMAGDLGSSSSRWGLRFLDPATEADYRTRRADRTVPFVRAGLMFFFFGGWTVLALGCVFDAAFARKLTATVLLCNAIFAAAYLATFPRSIRRWHQVAAGIAVVVWAASVIRICHVGLDAPELGTTAVMLGTALAVTAFRLSPAASVPAVFAIALVHEVLLGTSDTSGLAGGRFVHSVLTWAVPFFALMLSVVLERVERNQFRQEHTIARQHQMIDFERKRADDLLRNILPESIAERLKSSSDVIADYHAGVTVMFADVVNFTPLSLQLSADALVRMLDEVFTCLDELTEARGVEKIKTVGDAYMAVAGAPEPRDDHVEAIADLALDIVGALEKLSTTMPYPVEMRVGIATGDAIAGVIGRRKFAYDLWSDTVNSAARMESHGVPGKIQVTDEIERILRGRYVLTERGTIDVKGRGPTHTWFLEGRIDGPG
jgi:adenylate cyclase